jgi:hypothetical protein
MIRLCFTTLLAALALAVVGAADIELKDDSAMIVMGVNGDVQLFRTGPNSLVTNGSLTVLGNVSTTVDGQTTDLLKEIRTLKGQVQSLQKQVNYRYKYVERVASPQDDTTGISLDTIAVKLAWSFMNFTTLIDKVYKFTAWLEFNNGGSSQVLPFTSDIRNIYASLLVDGLPNHETFYPNIYNDGLMEARLVRASITHSANGGGGSGLAYQGSVGLALMRCDGVQLTPGRHTFQVAAGCFPDETKCFVPTGRFLVEEFNDVVLT